MAAERAHVIFSGYVQGVGFRFTARMIASGYPVTGWIRNLPDRTVELEAQGETEDVRAFIDRIHLEMKRYIAEAETTWSSAKPGEKGFAVRF